MDIKQLIDWLYSNKIDYEYQHNIDKEWIEIRTDCNKTIMYYIFERTNIMPHSIEQIDDSCDGEYKLVYYNETWRI